MSLSIMYYSPQLNKYLFMYQSLQQVSLHQLVPVASLLLPLHDLCICMELCHTKSKVNAALLVHDF
jgi:hypothetical protein